VLRVRLARVAIPRNAVTTSRQCRPRTLCT
jgi:hypothetical protein